jgi:uncharacterized membrane protein
MDLLRYSKNRGKITSYLLVLIISLAIFLRFYGIEHESLWNDELSSCYRSSFSTLSEVITKGVISDVHPPGFQILLFFVENFIGNSAFSLRLLPVIAGILTIPILFYVGRKLFDESTALLASAMLAVSPIHIWLSQEARPYAILIFLTTCSVYLLLNLISNLAQGKPNGIWNLIGFILTGIFLEYTHYFGLLAYLLEILILGVVSLKNRKSILTILLVSIVPLLAYLPWIPSLLLQRGTESYIAPPEVSNVAILFFEYMGWSKILLAALIITLSTATIIYHIRQREIINMYKLVAPILWILLPLGVSLIISYLMIPVFTTRNMMIALPAVFLLFAAAIHIVFSNTRQRKIFGISICCYMVVSLVLVRKHYTEPHRNQFREATTFVADNYNHDRTSIITAFTWNIAYFNYYFDRNPGNLSVYCQITDSSDFEHIRLLNDSISLNEVWLLWGHIEPESALIDSISSLFKISEYKPFIGAGVWHFSNSIVID